MFNIVKHKDSFSIRYNTKANLIIVIPILILVLVLVLFLLLLLFVDIAFFKFLFGVISIIILLCIVMFIVFTVKFELLIYKEGVLCKKAFTTVFLKWNEINEIAICCDKSIETASYHYYQPQTSIYFASRCLTDYEKLHFYDKHLSKSIKTVIWTEASTNEFYNLLEEISDYIQRFSNIEIIRFNCDSLKYNLQ